MEPVNIHPELEPLMHAAPDFDLSDEAVQQMRGAPIVGGEPPELSDAVERIDHQVDDDVVVRVHRPVGAPDGLPGLYTIHGGGYVLGTYDMDDAKLDKWCQKYGCVGVSVEYRLAPETPYPGPLDDCYAGLEWMHEKADELGVDTGRIGILGVSAGGGLAAALALLARDRGEIPIAFQLLECPMIDDRITTSSSRREGLPVWSRASNEYGWRSYLGDLHGDEDVPHYAAPARATDLAGLPPALVITGSADGFRDENIEYAVRLTQAGVPTDLHVLDGAPHGVQLFVGTDIARRWSDLVEDWLGRAFDATA